jgi:hypothetical protein
MEVNTILHHSAALNPFAQMTLLVDKRRSTAALERNALRLLLAEAV